MTTTTGTPDTDTAGYPARSGAPADGAVMPAVWLLGAHRDAGVSTLEHFLSFTADSDGFWPPGERLGEVSPFVVIVARASFKGLRAAQHLVLAHRAGDVGSGAQLLGVVTVAAAPTLDKKNRQFRDVVCSAVEHSWHIGWHRDLLAADTASLPRWHPLTEFPTAPVRGLPADIQTAGIDLVNTAVNRLPALFPVAS